METTIQHHKTFRVLMNGMSRPGKIFTLPAADDSQPAAVRLLECLLDQEVSFAVIDDESLHSALIHQTGSRPLPAEEADFIIVSKGDSKDCLQKCKKGSLSYPDQSATLLYLVDELREDCGHLLLSGPGIAENQPLCVQGLAAEELRRLYEVNHEFPLGVDAVFLDRQGRMACIPRSLAIKVM